MTMVPAEHRRGHLAYDAYRDAVGGVSAVTGADLPEFDDTNDQVKAGWIAAAKAVAMDVGGPF